MDDDRRTPHHEAPQRIVTGDDPRRLQAVIVFLVGVIVLLLIRPWGDGVQSAPVAPGSTFAVGSALTGSGSGSTAVNAAAAASTLAPSTGSEGPAARHVSCGSPDGWRATTVQQWPDRVLPVRSWIAILPTEATGPADPAIPLAPVAANRVTAIGYCAPLEAQLQPPAGANATLWTLAPVGPLRLTAVGLDPVTLFRQGTLWLPAPELAAMPREGGPAAWPPGRYVIEIADPGRTFVRWLGIEIVNFERRTGNGGDAAPSPGGSSVSGPDESPGSG